MASIKGIAAPGRQSVRRRNSRTTAAGRAGPSNRWGFRIRTPAPHAGCARHQIPAPIPNAQLQACRHARFLLHCVPFATV